MKWKQEPSPTSDTTHILPPWTCTILLHTDNPIPNLLSSKKIYQKNNNVHLKQVGAQDFLGMKFSAEVTIDLFEDREHGLLKFNLI